MQKTDALGYPFSGRFPGVGTPKQTVRFPLIPVIRCSATLDLCSAIAPNAALFSRLRGEGAAIPLDARVAMGGLRYQRDTKRQEPTSLVA